MHGEFKPPGGKLVAADVEVAGGELAPVQVSGDFFPGPDDALGRLNAALTGIPAAGDVPAMTAGSRPRLAATPCRPGSSGLGCPDWPRCTATSVVAAHSAGQTSLNTAIEFGNRLLTFPLAVIAIRRDQHSRQGTCNLPGVTLGAEEEVR